MKFLSSVPFTLLCSLTATSIHAQKEVTNADLLRKLEEIQGKVEKLEQRVASLEGKTPSPPAKPIALPKNVEARESFLKRLRNELSSAAARESGPWTNPATWENIRKGLTPSQVRGILGRPHKQKLSINPRISDVWIYEGDLDADGKSERGSTNFFNGRVTSFQKP